MLPDTGERYLSTPLFADVSADMNEEELEILTIDAKRTAQSLRRFMSGEGARMSVLRGIFTAVLLLAGAAPSWAQGYPNHPVRVVVGFPAGGPTDVIARLVSQKLSAILGQQFFVENLGGAGGNIAAGQVADVTADGYTIMAISTGFMVNPASTRRCPTIRSRISPP